MAAASVVVNGTPYTSDAGGHVIAKAAAGPVEILVTKDGFAPVSSSLVLAAGQEQEIEVELAQTLEETVTVSAMRRN